MTRDRGSAPFSRCCAVWLLVTTALAFLAATLAPDLRGAPELATVPFDEAIVLACEAALLVCAAWFWSAASVVVLDAARGRSGHRWGVPAGLRRALLAACGAALLGSVVVPASATSGTAVGGDRPAPTVAPVHGLPLPERATAARHVGLLVARQDVATALVRPGDTLWGLAVRDLPPGAADAAIARRWHQIYRANRLAIGPDPDLIHPHQQLRLPRR